MRLAPLFAALLIGCSSLDPAGLVALSRFDPMTAPPADMTVAVGVPDALDLRDGDAVFTVAYQPADPATPPVNSAYPLVIAPGKDGPRAPRDGETIYLARFAPDSAEDLAALQAEIGQARNSGEDGSGSISVAVEGGCLSDPGIEALPVYLWLRTEPEGAFAPLLTGRDLFEQMSPEDAARFRSDLAACS